MLSKDEKTNIITEYHTHETDTGSPEVQIALLTTRINQLTGHLNTHKHDQTFAARPAAHGRAAPPPAGLSGPHQPGAL